MDNSIQPANSTTHILLSVQVAFFSAALALTNLLASQIGTALDVNTEKKLGLIKQLQKSEIQETLLEGRLLALKILADAKQDQTRDSVLVKKTLQTIVFELQNIQKTIRQLQGDDVAKTNTQSRSNII